MTLLITSLQPRNLAELSAAAGRAWQQETDAIEVRIDAYTDDPAKLAAFLRADVDRTWIVTCRCSAEGGQSSGDARERAARLVAATRDTGAYIDFEFADWLLSKEVREQLMRASVVSGSDEHRLILSTHSFEPGAIDMRSRLEAMTSVREPVCLKIAETAHRIDDSFTALDLMREHGRRVIAIAMGEDGLWTRVLGRKLGAFATYCTLDADVATAPGQLTLDEMMNRYRWPTIDESTRVFGVLGDPIGHSMSPSLMNRWFTDSGINAVYLPLRVRRDTDCLPRFLDGCRQRPWLDIGGFSVTIPHKNAALKWVGDGADRLAQWIGAINTLSFGRNQVTGHNTDCHAAVSALVSGLRCDRSDLSGTTVDILGSGGSARAGMLGLFQLGCALTVYGRSEKKTQAVAEEFHGLAMDWDQRSERRGEILVNCTNVGMWPHVDQSPMPVDALTGCRLVFDLVYHPIETRLLCEARAAGAGTVSGLDMFIRQAAAQFELWTGNRPNTELGRQWVTREIARKSESP